MSEEPKKKRNRSSNKVARRRKLEKIMQIGKRLYEEALEEAKTNPKAFVEYLTVDTYIEMMLSNDEKTRFKAANDMLAYSLAKKRPIQEPKVDPNKKPFEPILPKQKQVEIPPHIQEKIHSIRTKSAQSQ